MLESMGYDKFKAWTTVQDWALVRESAFKITDKKGKPLSLLVSWFLSPRGGILQVERINETTIACISLVPGMPPERRIEVESGEDEPDDEPGD